MNYRYDAISKELEEAMHNWNVSQSDNSKGVMIQMTYAIGLTLLDIAQSLNKLAGAVDDVYDIGTVLRVRQ